MDTYSKNDMTQLIRERAVKVGSLEQALAKLEESIANAQAGKCPKYAASLEDYLAALKAVHHDLWCQMVDRNFNEMLYA